MSLSRHLHDYLLTISPNVCGVNANGHDKSTWRIDFAPEATDQQRAAAQEALLLFDPLNGERSEAVKIIDQRHATVTEAYLTPGVDYARKLREAEYVEDSATIDPALCPMLKASIGIDVPVSGDDVADLRSIATIVRRKDAETAALLGPLDHIRRVAKAAIRAASSSEEIAHVLESTTFRRL